MKNTALKLRQNTSGSLTSQQAQQQPAAADALVSVTLGDANNIDLVPGEDVVNGHGRFQLLTGQSTGSEVLPPFSCTPSEETSSAQWAAGASKQNE
ncbi:hypothetical protein CgunFtcFv8_012295 [Champsocephalus gunnari]|uniref:Uncharacterized protein n=1 Tax=Champsocephalus gunnari TaxID=52237 RepID=A0AAN8DAX3_CHAGU|nr:hypothetical protein CgunFtcFv8_012295 [Champsocephalus gunnari]